MDSTMKTAAIQVGITMVILVMLAFFLPGWIFGILLFFYSCMLTLAILLIGIYRKL